MDMVMNQEKWLTKHKLMLDTRQYKPGIGNSRVRNDMHLLT